MWSEVELNFPGRGMACGEALAGVGRVGGGGALPTPGPERMPCGGDRGEGSGRVLEGGFGMVYPEKSRARVGF